MDTEQFLTIAKNALEDKKAIDIKVLDVRKISSITDFMIVATGNTARQVIALAKHVVEKAKAHGHRPLGEEGGSEWALVDLGDVIVHIMQPETRDFYQLEKLWSDMAGEIRLSQLSPT
ncbi:MAG: ribosome silencing factor [Pseudomonadota bacterium]